MMLPQALTRHSAPSLVEQINNGDWLTRQEAESLREELFYQRGLPAQSAGRWRRRIRRDSNTIEQFYLN